MMKIKGLRWWIIALVCSGAVVNYLSRNTLAVLASTLMTEMRFSTPEYSYVVGAFQLAYTIMQPVCGYVLDLFGTRTGFALFALMWSLASCLHGFATGWLSLAFFRGWLGLTEAAAIPAAVKAISEWFPAKERSVAMGLFNIGTSLGAMLAPPLVVFVLVRYSWRAAFLVTGGLGFLFAGVWWLFYRPPLQHSRLGAEERIYIISGQGHAPPSAEGGVRKPAVMEILRTRRFWGIAIPRFLAEPAWQTFNFWIPVYLSTERGMNLHDIALFAWLPFLAADIGSVTGGFFSPFFMKLFKTPVVNSRLAGIVLGATCMIGPGCIGLTATPYGAIGLLCVGAFAHQMISCMINTLSADLFGSHEVATASGLAGTAAWAGGLSFSLVVGALAHRVGFSALFLCLSVFDIIAAIVAIVLLRDRGHVVAPQSQLLEHTP
jgi:MFS transporter, ACS family, aldohexuronate transporter